MSKSTSMGGDIENGLKQNHKGMSVPKAPGNSISNSQSELVKAFRPKLPTPKLGKQETGVNPSKEKGNWY